MIYVESQAATVQSCGLKIRSQQALGLTTVSLNNSPVSRSLQLGKINGIVALDCHVVKLDVSVALFP